MLKHEQHLGASGPCPRALQADKVLPMLRPSHTTPAARVPIPSAVRMRLETASLASISITAAQGMTLVYARLASEDRATHENRTDESTSSPSGP